LAIKSTTSVNYLGATLDQTWSFSEMAQSLLTKANARLMLCTGISSTLITQYTKQHLVMSLIQ